MRFLSFGIMTSCKFNMFSLIVYLFVCFWQFKAGLSIIKGVIWCNFKFSIWIVTSWLCIDKNHKIAKTKVSKPKRYSLSVTTLPRPPKTAHSNMSTALCGNICGMPPKCAVTAFSKFSNRSSVDAAMSGRRCVFLGESKRTLFGLPKVDVFRNH